MGEDDNKQFSIEEILEEQKKQRSSPEAGSAEGAPAGRSSQRSGRERRKRQAAAEDLSSYASAADRGREEDSGKKKKKEKGFGLFGRKKKVPDYVEEDEAYYGIQLKPIDEYTKGYNPVTGEFSIGADSYASLFEESKKALDDEVEKNFQKLQQDKERRQGPGQAMTGGEPSAQPPVQPPAAHQEAIQRAQEEARRKAAEEDARRQAAIQAEEALKAEMEAELQEARLARQQAELKARQQEEQLAQLQAEKEEAMRSGGLEQQEAEQASEQNAAQDEAPIGELQPGTPLSENMGSQDGDKPIAEDTAQAAGQAAVTDERPGTDEAKAIGEAAGEELKGEQAEDLKDRIQVVPKISNVFEYRSRGATTHIINVKVLQDTLQDESEVLLKQSRQKKAASQKQVREEASKRVELEGATELEGETTVRAEPIDDYNSPEDAKAIGAELNGDMRDLRLRLVITGGTTLLLALVNIIFGRSFNSGQAANTSTPIVFIVMTLVLLGVAIAVNYRTIGNGLRALFAFNANSDSAIAVATVGVILQAIISFFNTQGVVDKEQHLYAAVLTAALFANAAGKLTMLRRIHSNFRFVSSKEQKYSVQLYTDEDNALKMTGNAVSEQPVVAYQTKTGFLDRFLEMSYLPDPAETSSQLLAPVGLIAALVLCIISMIITRSVPTAISALAAALLTSVAFSNMLSVNMSVSRLAKLARRAGGMIVGYEAVHVFGDVNAVAIDAEELFPTGTVTLNGIKTYLSRDETEEAVLAASALMDAVGGPLCGVFEQVITENEESLPKAEEYSYEDERGIVGKVDGKRIYIGSKELLMSHKIEIPAKEEETQYSVGGRQVVYIAVENRVAAMLIMTYAGDRRKKNELQRLEDSGVSIVVRTTDPNITSHMLSRLFGIDASSVSVMASDMGQVYKDLVKEEIPRCNAVMATKGRVESLITLISACIDEKRSTALTVAMQTGAVALGFILVAFLACFGAMNRLSAFGLFLFEMLWILIILLLPKLRR